MSVGPIPLKSAPPPPEHSRTGVMLKLIPVVAAALADIPGLDPKNFDTARRIYRALLTIGTRLMLDAGYSPEDTCQQAFQAVGVEVMERAAKEKESGATQPPASC